MTVRQIAAPMDLSSSRVGQFLAEPDRGHLLDQLRVLRQRWKVDADPVTRAAADHIVANLTASEMADREPGHVDTSRHHRSVGAPELSLFDNV
ncbi:hypothetical protein ACGF5S_31910 [Nocardia nova]|uniref:hypothetical protein n=1 Tax=Nocardia nova TaxID=37330 RepID=UPI00371EC5AA